MEHGKTMCKLIAASGKHEAKNFLLESISHQSNVEMVSGLMNL